MRKAKEGFPFTHDVQNFTGLIRVRCQFVSIAFECFLNPAHAVIAFTKPRFKPRELVMAFINAAIQHFNFPARLAHFALNDFDVLAPAWAWF